MTSSGGETRSEPSGWTTDTLRMYIQTQLDQLSALLDERYNAQQRAMETAFSSQQTAMHTAFAAADKALERALDAAEKAVNARAAHQDREFHEHLEQYRHETTLAFESSDRAIIKAEIATEKRFDSVNEFRAQLNDQARTFMPRAEADAALARTTERNVELATQIALCIPRAEALAIGDRNAEKIVLLNDRMNKSEGRGVGLNAGWIYLLGGVAAVGTIISLYLALRGG